MSFDVLTATPGGVVRNGAVIRFPYPTGRDRTDYEGNGAFLSINSGEYDFRQSQEVFFLTYGDSDISLTWSCGPTIPTGKVWNLRIPLTNEYNLIYNEPRRIAGPLFAIFGTSITEQCSRNALPPAASPSRVWYSDGYATWLRILTQQRINLPISNNFGVSGNTFQQMLVRQDAVMAVKPDYVIVEGGTNDFVLNTFETIRDNWLAIVRRFRDAGITPIILPAPPRVSGTLTAAQLLVQHRFYNFQREFCLNNRGYMFCDYLGYWVDQTSATSDPISGRVRADGVHPSASGAFYMGKALADMINPLLPPRQSHFNPAADIYDATNNPTGNLLLSGSTNLGTLAGTGGTQQANAGLTYAGTGFASGSFFQRLVATSTATVTLDKENPRTDDGRLSGERQIVQIAAASGGGATEVYNILYTLSLANIAVGDWYYAEAAIEVTGAPTNCSALELYLIETRPTNSQAATDMYRSAVPTNLPATTWSGVFRTPPIQRQSDTQAIQLYVRAWLATNAGAAGITYKIGDIAVRKVDPRFV